MLKLLRPKDLIESGCRLVVASALLISAWSHLQNEYVFYATVLEYGLVPLAIAGPVSSLLPYLQIVVAGCLFASTLLRPALCLCFALLGMYTLAQASILIQGGRLNCGCFGALSDEPLGLVTLGRNGVLMLCTVVALVLSPKVSFGNSSGDSRDVMLDRGEVLT